jgi:hypothetical protein
MAPLVDRTEFRKVLKQIVGCLRENLERPGLTPLTPEQIVFWLQNITLEDIQVVAAEFEADGKK